MEKITSWVLNNCRFAQGQDMSQPQPDLAKPDRLAAEEEYLRKFIKVYHGTNDNFRVFNPRKGAQGVIWVTDDIDAIKNGTSGAVGTKNIMERYLTGTNFAGWEEYDKLMLDQIESMGYDGIKLPNGSGHNNYVLFNNKGIKTRRQLLNEFRKQPLIV
jgi:hypothetical protein